MPIKSLVADAAGGRLVQVCAGCGAEHTISFNRGGQKSKTGPFALRVGDTLIVQIDADPPRTATLAPGALASFESASAAELATALRPQMPGARICDDAGGVLIESEAAGDASRVEVVGGTACAALGFVTAGERSAGGGRPVLGVAGDTTLHDPNVIALRRCNNCGANECLVRTFDACAPEHHGTHFHEHRKAVNALAQHARAQGWSHPAHIARHAVETHAPVDINPAFPTSALDLAGLMPSHQHALHGGKT